MLAVDGGYESGNSDVELLATGRRDGLVIITNDVDFVELADGRDHAGIIKYQQYGHSAKAFAGATRRIDRYVSSAEFQNHVEWLANWMKGATSHPGTPSRTPSRPASADRAVTGRLID